MKANRNIIIVIGIFVILIVGAAIMALLARQAELNKAKQATDSQQRTPEQIAETPMAAITIVYTDEGFDPSSYMVAVGDAVAVVNNSSRVLEFASDDHPSHLKETELNINALQPGESGMFTVTKAGTWGFHDHLQPKYSGVLTVEKKK